MWRRWRWEIEGKMGSVFQGSVWCFRISLPSGWERRSRDRENVFAKGMDGWWRDDYVRRVLPWRRSVEGLSVVFAVMLWLAVSIGLTLTEVRLLEFKILRPTFRQKKKAGESWIENRERTLQTNRVKWRKMGLSTMIEKNNENIWKTMVWTTYVKRFQLCNYDMDT